MVKVEKSLKILYTNMYVHAFIRVAEKVKELFPKVNTLINNGEKMILKAPSRISIFF